MLNAKLLFTILVCGTVLGLAGTDLVLPAIPSLPNSLPGSIEQAQLVLASFVAGTALGLLIFGELGARFNQGRLLLIALLAYSGLSFVATLAADLEQLVLIRFIQGLMCSAPAVFAPSIIRNLFDERGALRAIGLMGSIESLTPALAPVIGAWLLNFTDWRGSFYLTSGLALSLAVIWLVLSWRLPPLTAQPSKQGYWPLFTNREFLRQTLSHACTLGGLLIFVFGAPTVIIRSMGGELSDFVTMQIVGISLFIISANSTHWLVDKLGRERIIMFGSLLTALGCGSILLYGLSNHNDPRILWLLFIPVNLGLGLRGPPGFHKALVAAGSNDARGAALLILAILGVAAIGTAITALFIQGGLVPLAASATIVATASVLFLLTLKPLNAHQNQ